MGDHVTTEQRLRELTGDTLGEDRDQADPTFSAVAVRKMLRDLAGCARADIREARKAGFDAGFQLAARVEQQAARNALGAYALQMLGKDAGDGWVDLGALGTFHA